MPHTVCIRDAAWVAAWDPAASRHVYRRGIDVAFSDGRLAHVGPAYAGPADRTIDGRDLFVLPGLVDIHSHPTLEPSYKGVREEHGVPQMYMSGLYERGQALKLDLEGRKAAAEVAYAELLASGVTTLADLSAPFEGWLDLLGRSGLRVSVAPGYASARWAMSNRHELHYAWDEAAGRRGFEAALRVIDAAAQHPSGRLSGVVYPAQLDTCTEDLLRDSVDAAKERGLPITTHAAQSVNEFLEMVKRHGITPLQWAHQVGLLGPNAVLGHAIFVDDHSWIRWHTRRDVALLAETGTSVAHCPTPFARYGQMLEDFGRYRRAGVNMGIGT
ncbi:MAG: amidohydrolase family protein, partial [Alphaproteobacteria bacterium]